MSQLLVLLSLPPLAVGFVFGEVREVNAAVRGGVPSGTQITRHTSHVTRHTSHITRHTSLRLIDVRALLGRVCILWGRGGGCVVLAALGQVRGPVFV